jgi:hypothetical protein
MAELSWPFENQNTTETQYSELFKRLQNNGAAGDPGSTSLRVTGDSSGMNVKMAAGFGLVRGHMYQNTDVLTLTVSTAAASPRIDLAVLELNPTANTIEAKVIAGTPATTPSAPSLTQTSDGIFQLALAQISVAGSATTISAGNVADLRPFLGSQWGVWTNDTRPASPIAGRAGFNTTSGRPEYWDGTAWSGFSPTEISAAIITSGTLNVDRIAALAITDAKLAANSVTTAKIANDAVTTDKLASSASVDFVSGKRILVQTTQPSSSGRITGDVWISY